MRRKTDFVEVEDFIKRISDTPPQKILMMLLKPVNFQKVTKKYSTRLTSSSSIGEKSREVMARKLIEEEELKAIKKTEKTDIIAKIGPALD